MVLTKTPICNFEEKAHDFYLKGVDNKFYKLENCVGSNGTIIMFICNHCPYVKAIIKELIEDINELDQTETLLQADLDLKGTSFGFDQETQVNTFSTDNVLTFLKSLEDTVRLDLDKSSAYTVILIQNGKSTQIIVNGGGSSTITIKQGS